MGRRITVSGSETTAATVAVQRAASCTRQVNVSGRPLWKRNYTSEIIEERRRDGKE